MFTFSPNKLLSPISSKDFGPSSSKTPSQIVQLPLKIIVPRFTILVGRDDLLLNEPDALISALWFWNKRNLSKYADKDDVVTITKLINGGKNGLAERQDNVSKLKGEF
mgnify:CR=1 FL=1